MRPCTWGMLGQLECLIAGQLLEKVERHKGRTRGADYRTRLDHAVEMIEAGKAQSRDTFTLLCWLMLRDGVPTPDLATVREMVVTHAPELQARMRILNWRDSKQSDAGKPIPFATLAALLAGEPWHLDLDQVAELTPHQTDAVYGHPRDDHGRVQMPGNSREERIERMRATFVRQLRKQGLSDQEIDARWEAMFDRSIKPRAIPCPTASPI